MSFLKELLSNHFNNYIRILKSVFTPVVCYGCNTNKISGQNNYLCTSCLMQLPFTDHFERNYINSVHEKFYGRFNIEFGAALIYFSPKSIVGSLIHHYKYRNKKYLGTYFAEMICEKIDTCDFLPQFDLITSIPIHKKKFESRGFNQSTIIAEYISEHINCPVNCSLLIKIFETTSQTRKNRKQRLMNIMDSIAIDEKNIETIKGKHILLVDDTLTTGATIESCGRVLLKNGAKSISIMCISQAV